MRILIDLQTLQTPGAATRGVGKFTNGLLGALSSTHEVVGMRRAGAYLVPPVVNIPEIEIRHGLTDAETEQLISGHRFDVVVNCSGPYWSENVIVSGLSYPDRPIVASIFYDAIPWVFPDAYLQAPHVRCGYHNRCIDLYANADLVCAISSQSAHDAVCFGYATGETIANISIGVERPVCEARSARDSWKIPRPYLLNVSGDEFRKNPEVLIAAFLQSEIRKSRCLVMVVSNDAETGFSRRMTSKYGDLKKQGVFVLPHLQESDLGALYRDCDAFVFTSLYEGFGIPLVEAMHFGKWIISSRASSLDEVAGPALLAVIEEPANLTSVIHALNHAGNQLDEEGPLDDSVPRDQAGKFTWAQVLRNFDDAVTGRRGVLVPKPESEMSSKQKLFWASPFPKDVSGIAFYSEDLIGPVSRQYDVILVPNTISSFVPTSKTGRFKIVQAQASAILSMDKGNSPFVFYNIGNSHFHLELIELLFAIPGVVLLHDSFIGGLEGLWRNRISSRRKKANFNLLRSVIFALRRLCRTLSNVDQLFSPLQPTRFRHVISRVVRLPGVRPAVRILTSIVVKIISAVISALLIRANLRPELENRPLVIQIIEKSKAMLFLGEHAKSLIDAKYLNSRPTHVVPLYARYRGAISEEKRKDLRFKYAIPDGAFVVTTTGFQTRMKLPVRLIQSCIDLQNQEDGVNVYVQVLGRFFDPGLEEEVRALVKRSGIAAFVTYDFIDEETLTERVALSDVAVFLREWDTGGPSAGLNDALGMGVACLITDDFAFREYPNAAVRRVANDKLTEGLMLLYKNPELRRALSDGGLQYAKDMSIERIAGRLCDVFSFYRQNPLTLDQIKTSEFEAKCMLHHVFVDITFSLMNNTRSGLQRVEREITSGLRKIDPNGNYFTCIAWDSCTRQFYVVSLTDYLNRRDILPSLESWLISRPAADIGVGDHFFILGSNWPLGDSYFADVTALTRRGVKLSVLIPDLIPLRHRWNFYAHHPKGTTIDRFTEFCQRVLPVATHVMTISNYVKRDIQKLLVEIGCGMSDNKNSLKVHVLDLGSDWTSPFIDTTTNDPSLGRNRMIQNPFLLFVSTLEKRKNHGRLFEAFLKVRKKVDNLDLVLVGHVDGSFSNKDRDFIKQNPWIHYYEKVDDSTLARLYQECLFTIYPSLDEGYGLPVIESFRHGKFCLASKAGAIPEAGGIFADYFEPCDVETLSEKILTYVADPLELQKRTKLLFSYRSPSWLDTTYQIVRIFYGGTNE